MRDLHEPVGDSLLTLQALAVADAPRLFAVGIQYDGPDEHDEPDEDGIVAWGMAFGDRTQVVSTDGAFQLTTTRPECAVRHFQEEDATTHLIWVEKPSAPGRRP